MSKHATLIKCPCCNSYLLSKSMFEIYSMLPATYKQIKEKLGKNPGVEWMLNRMLKINIVKHGEKVKVKRNQLAIMWQKTDIMVYEYIRLQ